MNRKLLNAVVLAFCVVSVSDPLIAKKGGYPYPGGGDDSSRVNPEIAFHTNGRGKYAFDLVIANRDGSHPTIIYSSSSPVRVAEFCPTDEKYILFRESVSGGNVLRRLFYDYSDTDIWVDGNVETIETGHNLSSFDISPDGQNVVFNDGDGKLWLKSLVDPSPSSQYVFGDTLMFAYKAVWLQTENRLAIAYDDKTDTEGVMITVIDIDPNVNPVDITFVRAPVTIPAETIPMTSIESARTHDGVIVSLRSETEVVDRKGAVSFLYKYVVHEWDLREQPDELVPLGPVGGEVEGTQPCFSADDLFVLTTVGDDILSTSVLDGTSSVVGYGSSSDWKADPALSPQSP